MTPLPLLSNTGTGISVWSTNQRLKHEEDELIRANNSDFSEPRLNSSIKGSVSSTLYKRCGRLLENWGVAIYVWGNSKAWILVNCLFSSPWELLVLKLNRPCLFFFFFLFWSWEFIAPYSSRRGSQLEFKALLYLQVPELVILCNFISMVI